MIDAESLKVSDLLSANGKQWDVMQIRRIFIPKSANAIIQIQLAADISQDTLFWQHDPFGDFSVKTAYRNLAARRGTSLNPIQ